MPIVRRLRERLARIAGLHRQLADPAERVTENTGRISVVAARLEIAPFDLDAGDRPLDSYVDMPPYLNQPHLKLALEGYSSTSIGLIIRRPA